MSDDLVERLRATTDGATVNPDGPEAAARIAELEAALATARRDALAEIKQDTDELIEQGRQDGLEQAALIAELIGGLYGAGVAETVSRAIRAALEGGKKDG